MMYRNRLANTDAVKRSQPYSATNSSSVRSRSALVSLMAFFSSMDTAGILLLLDDQVAEVTDGQCSPQWKRRRRESLPDHRRAHNCLAGGEGIPLVLAHRLARRATPAAFLGGHRLVAPVA